jgi:mono/diheme cytochrome c family protein
MVKVCLVLLLAGTVPANFVGIAQPPAAGIHPPLRRTPVQSGPRMYAAYCTGCHGVHGRGNGPVAPALRVRPPDLTRLAQRNGGVFPYEHVASVLQYGAGHPAHASAEMPIWADMFRTLSAPSQIDGEVHLRISHLASYLKDIQR